MAAAGDAFSSSRLVSGRNARLPFSRSPVLPFFRSFVRVMTVSLIVCTRNRATRLPDFFAPIARLESPPGGWELVLVDNASSDASAAVIADFAATAPFEVRCAHAPVPGLGRARNVGIAQARGRILVFTDDDCYPRPDYLRAFVDVFEQHPVGVAGGRIVLHDPTDAVLGMKDVEAPVEIAPRSFVPAGVVHGANMAVRREVVTAIGGFDPRLGVGTACIAGEDIELVARAVWAGWAARHDPRPIVAHHHGRKPGPDAERQQRSYDYGRGAYYAKLLLDPQARATYARGWYRRARRRGLGRTALGRLSREIGGAARYLIPHFARPETVPRFVDRPS
jgi:glycosyltransferase involved in cell wall biosynthesis